MDTTETIATAHAAVVAEQTAGWMLVPNIGITVFAETDAVAELMKRASSERAMARARVHIVRGGIEVAIDTYRRTGTPDLLVIESQAPPEVLLPALDVLADQCLPETKVVIIGHRNDVRHYRELLAHGISDYLVTPFEPAEVAAAISRLYADGKSPDRGRLVAFIGTRGGTGASVLAHNTAWVMAHQFDLDVLLGDADMLFGTAALDFNLDGVQGGFVEALENAQRFDADMLSRIAAKPHERLSVLTSPASLDKRYKFKDEDFEKLVEFAHSYGGYSVIDLPHLWTEWARKLLASADDIVMVATPDLASLRNAKMLLDHLKKARPSEGPPRLVVNQVGVPKRPEINPEDFAESLGLHLTVTVPYDPHLFGVAAGDGKMLDQVNANALSARATARLAAQLVGDKGRSHRRNKRGLVERLLGK